MVNGVSGISGAIGKKLSLIQRARRKKRRKLQFLKMINEEIVNATNSIVGEAATLPDPEVIEETEEGFISKLRL